MKSTRVILIIAQLMLMSVVNAHGQESEVGADSLHDTFSNHYSGEFFEEKYHNYTLEHFMDNYYPNGHYQIETTGNFSQPDQYVFSLTGYSFKWNKFYYDGLRINDLSFPGASLHKPMLLDKDLDIDLVESRVEFTSNNNAQTYFYGQLNNGSFGERVPWTNDYIHLMHGHKSGPEKIIRPVPNRKKTRAAGTVYFSLPNEKHNNYGYVAVGRRMITNFNFIEMDDYFGEDFLQLHYHGDINLNDQKLDYLITYSQRDNLYSEFFYGRAETAKYNNLNLSLLARDKKFGIGANPLNVNVGLNYSFKNISKNDPNFSRNITDQDGESLEPFYPGGNYSDFILSANGNKKITDDLSFEFDIYNGLIHFSPEQRTYRNSIFYENNLTPFQSLYITNWNSQAFSTGILENTAGFRYNKSSSDRRFTINLKANLTYDALYFSPSSISTLNYEVGMHLKKKMGRKVVSTLNLGKRRVPYEFDQVKFLSDKYQSGESYYWNDTNDDQSFQTNEQGILFNTTGGKYHNASDNLKQPEIYYLDYGMQWDMGKRWELTFLAQYRKFANQWTVEYENDVADIGQFSTNDQGQDIYYLNGGNTINYNVRPFNQQLFESLAEKKLGWLFNSPFYGGVTMNIEKKTLRTYFYISATAYEVVGLSPMGNGVLTNNLGVLSESLANPNTYIENLGRLDSDRAYLVRIYYHQNLGKKWKLGFQVKYKDGQPVNRNVFETSANTNGTQFAFWNIDIKGINPFTGQFGIREAGIWNYELRFQHALEIAGHQATIDLNIYNIMDVSGPLNNYNFPEPDGQFTLEYQIPRGILLSLKYNF